MAKRSNNFRSKKLQVSKPYDVSNSFVKKVASRVTELLPQSIWPTKWFSSVNHETHSQGDGRNIINSPPILEKNNDADPIPSKRARIPLDSSFGDPLFSTSSSASDYETRRLRNPLPTSSENVNDVEAVAGPSGIQFQYSVGKLDSPKPKSRDRFCYNDKTEVNGGDHSDSSESTSGCSSLPQGDHNSNQPKAGELQVNGPEPVTRNSVKRRRKEGANYSSMAIHSSHIFSSFGGYTSSSRAAPVPVGRRRNPSFNPDAFGSQHWSGEKTNIKDRIVNSPFYSGRTTYGGVSAYQSSLNRTENQLVQSRQRSIRVHPVQASETNSGSSGMSNTARRILEALEMFSSPLQDAKKIPLSGNVNIKRRKVLANSDISQSPLHSPMSSSLLTQDTTTISHRLGDFTPPVRELVVPTVPDILAMRRRQKLQGSTVAAREVANETSALPFSVEKVSERVSYPWPNPDGRNGGRHGGKIKSKEEIDIETVEEPDLPNIALPITSLPKFDFILPPTCPPSYKQADSSMFKFSSPIAFSSASETLVSSNKFTFSSPLKATSKEGCSKSDPRTDIGSTTENVQKPLKIEKEDSSAGKSVAKKEKMRDSEKGISENNTESKSRGVGVILKRIDQGNCNNMELALGNNLPVKGVFGEQFKPAAGSWECGTCMVRNSSEASQCVACETVKSHSLKSGFQKIVKSHTETKSGFGDHFKPPSGSWLCDVCMINNPSAANKCQACETPRSKGTEVTSCSENLKADSSGFGDRFKKPDGAWDCSICLVRNKAGGPPKCVACEAPKPGAEPLDTISTPVSSAKFSLGNKIDSGFCFGMDKAGDIPKKDCYGEGKSAFAFGSASNSGPTDFVFGVKPEGETKSLGFTFGTSTTSELSEPDHPKNFSVPQSSPKFMFGAKEVCGRTTKSSSTELTKVQSESETKGDNTKVLDTKPSREPELKFSVGSATKMASNVGRSAASSKSTVVAELKPTFTFTSAEDKKDSLASINSFDSTLSATKLKDGKASSITFGSPISPVSNSPAFGTTSTVAGWNNSPLFPPKASLFSHTTASTLSNNSNSDGKCEESPKAAPPTFRLGDASKMDSMNSKQQEVCKRPSSNFKFEEPPKTTGSIFSVEDKTKTISTAAPTLTSNTIASNPFSCTTFSSLNNEKITASNEEPNTVAVSLTSASDDSTAVKSSNAGPIFMFGSGSSSTATAFNLIGQKQPTQTDSATKDEPIKPFANMGATPNVFGNLSSSKAPIFGSASSSPSPAATASETRSVTNAVFASPTSNPAFGNTVSNSATLTSTATTTAVSSTSSAFGSPIFGSATRNFPAVGSSTLTFGSSAPTPLAAAPSAFGVAPSSTAVFGVNSASASAPFSFSGPPKSTTDEPQPPQQPTNTPFVFGGGSAPSAQPFNFSSATNKPQFSFGGSTQTVVGTSAPAPAPGTAPALGGFSFGDASKGNTFGSSQPPASIAGGASNPFGVSSAAPVANVNPIGSSFCAPLGEANAAPAGGTFGAPTFNFGSSQSNPMFSFNNNQPGTLPTNISQPSGFNFGQASQPSSAPQQVTFNPNMPPSFNFTGGATPQFTATPGGLNAAAAANPMQRRFKKAVRRSQQPR